jgi:hypothetical protein
MFEGTPMAIRCTTTANWTRVRPIRTRPTLRRTPGSGTGPVDDNDKQPADQDDRPTLKRRDSDSASQLLFVSMVK